MALAYGDGFAALIGKKFGWKPFYVFKNKKTVSGCAGMFSATFSVSKKSFRTFAYIGRSRGWDNIHISAACRRRNGI